MVIKILDIVAGADTIDQGAKVLSCLLDALAKDDAICVSFAGVHTATSSFVNIAFVGLLKNHSFADVKRRIRVTNSSRQINEMIKTRMEREALIIA